MTPTPQKYVDEVKRIMLSSNILICASWVDTAHKAETFNKAITEIGEKIALALSLAEARGRLAGLEEACKAICPLCDRAVKFSNNYPDTHLVGHELQDCDARKIRSRQRSSK